MYQCIYCKAQYDHAGSYEHNAYKCPRVKGRGKAGLLVVGLLMLATLQGCEWIKGMTNPTLDLAGSDKADITVYKGDKVYKFKCDVDVINSRLVNCQEVL